MGMVTRLSLTSAPRSTILIRLAVGWVFVSEGIQKFLFANEVGAGRFERIGIAWPQVMGPLVGVIEIVCGALLLAGLLTRLATIPVLVTMAVAVISTKVPILLGHGYGPFSLPKASYYGLWGMLHEARTDFSMILGLLFLLINGAGQWSIDGVALGKFEH
jgi:uncharacterized membrane protein YphA (DoxX/SURF4 family)